MTAEQKLKREILLTAKSWNRNSTIPAEITDENIDSLWKDAEENNDELRAAKDVIRNSGTPTGLPIRDYSQFYGCDEVGMVCCDGTAVGWTYWHGGEKHGDPSSIEWISGAYDLNHRTELVPTTIFSKPE